MLQATIIGHLGADASVKVSNGKEFTSFRVAHSDRWSSQDGSVHEQTIWVDCILQGAPAVVQYLKKGQCVYISGNVSLRVYSSAKDRCMKAGLTINARFVELVSKPATNYPTIMFSTETGQQHNIQYLGYCEELVSKDGKSIALVDDKGAHYVANADGFISPASADEKPSSVVVSQADGEPF